jgi:hypothetical protein
VSVSENARTVGRYDKFELTFTLSRTYENPFDPCVVDITAAFAQPDGNAVTVPAFFYQDYQYLGGRYTNGCDPCWKVRFAPSQAGEHSVSSITVVDANGVTVIDPHATFTCIPSDRKGIIRIDARPRLPALRRRQAVLTHRPQRLLAAQRPR